MLLGLGVISNPGVASPAPGLPSFEPYRDLHRQIITGGLRVPDPNQRHQALFGLVALCISASSVLARNRLVRWPGSSGLTQP